MHSRLPGDSSNEGQLFRRIYTVVRQIPAGQVASYGQIAAIVGRCTPRLVGYAMAALPFDSNVPWHRVINHQGRISRRSGGDDDAIQQQLLEREGVRFDEHNRVNFNKFGWRGPLARRGTPRGKI
jgi:methylated-DNA-protein-cysteine methyltransferase-like protein